MEQWQLACLGLKSFPQEFAFRELSAFFTFSHEERVFIDSHRLPCYRMTAALLLGFLRMTGRLPAGSASIPESLWEHLAHELKIDPPPRPDTLRSVYGRRARTLADHQVAVREFMAWLPLTGDSTRDALLWLRQRLSEQPRSPTLLQELRDWLYQRRTLIPRERALRALITRALRAVEAAWRSSLVSAYGESVVTRWSALVAQAPVTRPKPHRSWRVVVVGGFRYPLSTLFDIIESLYATGIQDRWPGTCHALMVRYYGMRHAQRPSRADLQLSETIRTLEAACFMRYALCRVTDQLGHRLCSWIKLMLDEAEHDVDTGPPDFRAPAREFAHAVKALTTDANRPVAEVYRRLNELADAQLELLASTRASRVRERLLSGGPQARMVLVRLVPLAFEAPAAHPVIGALNALRDLYARHSYTLPPDAFFPFSRAWRTLVNNDDRRQALHAFEWATLLALRAALLDQSVRMAHSIGSEP